jgi:glycosyltransferase involved in cell wall biosynthesis
MLASVERVAGAAPEIVTRSPSSDLGAEEGSAFVSAVGTENSVLLATADNSAARPVTAPTADSHQLGHGSDGNGAATIPAGEAQVGAQSALRGSIDKATWTTIKGWAWDPRTPEKRVHLELVEGEELLVTAFASDERTDLVPAGIGDGRHAFTIDLEPGLLPDGQHILHLRCADTGADVPGSPIVLEPSLDAPESAFRWHLDQITDKEAAGWIVPRNGPLRHCVVALKEGGAVLVRAVASQFRTDLLSAGIGDGCYAFRLPMPRSLLDGEIHLLEIVEEDTGLALTKEPIEWRSAAGTAGAELTGVGAEKRDTSAISSARRTQAESLPVMPRVEYEAFRPQAAAAKRPVAAGKLSSRVAAAQAKTRMLFDVSDLIYYIGHHSNLTGIQRVQSSIVLSVIDGKVLAPASVIFLSFNARSRTWVAIPTGFLISLLRDLFLPDEQRLISFPAEEARYGVLPGAQPFDGVGVLDDGNPSVLCLLGAAWVQQDYVHRVLAWKRRFGTRFVMTVHDLIPIYARETCDQDTARVFEEFMRRALPHVDHILAVSDNTAKDVRRYLATLQLREPAITVTKNGSSFAEFLPGGGPTGEATLLDLPERFVLFVATIEGRKNHQLIFNVWRRMIERGDDPPHLICVGRLGWKATAFVSALVETNYLDGRIHLLREISDVDLWTLYKRCLFTVCPTLYEGWGLPIGESLAMGKICVSSDRASVPEVAGECGVYIDVDRPDQALDVIRSLIYDKEARMNLEAKIRRDYVPITWHSVAERVVSACEGSVTVEWEEPYPYTALPYSTEISFGRLDQDLDGTGELVLSRIVDARLGHFKYEPLDQQSFLLGEAIRSGGAWAEPERWGTWLCHSGGDVVFGLAADASQFDFVWVRVRVNGVLQDHPIRLLANGELQWEGRIGSQSKDIMLRVRRRSGASSYSRLRISVEVDLSTESTMLIAASDSRIPTVGLERLIVVPENDLKTRLDVLSKLAMSRQ